MAWRCSYPRQAGARGVRFGAHAPDAGRDGCALVPLAASHLVNPSPAEPGRPPRLDMSRDTSFYYSFLVLPPSKRKAIIAVWDFCRAVDDAVDEVVPEHAWGGALPEDARERAALQLTNIIRDVAVDLERGRVYLPLDDLERFGCREADLLAGRVTPAVRDLLAHECARAREYYRRAAADLPRDDARSLVAAQIMGAIYFEILRRIERAGYDVFSRRIRVPRP